ncbi:MAG: DNRLRE domain-containing protein, partial [Deltaproteobacteria bacterium]
DVCETTTEITITANRDNPVHGKSSSPDRRDEVHNWSTVEILSKADYTVAGLFGFNWFDNITSSQTVVSATLRLTIDEINQANSSNDYHAYGTNDDWDESTLSWNSYLSKKPNTGDGFSSLDNKTITSTGAYDFDVTSYVQTVHNADNSSLSFWVEDLADSGQTVEMQTEKNSGTRAQLILSVR